MIQFLKKKLNSRKIKKKSIDLDTWYIKILDFSFSIFLQYYLYILMSKYYSDWNAKFNGGIIFSLVYLPGTIIHTILYIRKYRKYKFLKRNLLNIRFALTCILLGRIIIFFN